MKLFTKPVKGEIRDITFFAIFPVEGIREYRWLEWVTLRYRWHSGYDDYWECLGFVFEVEHAK